MKTNKTFDCVEMKRKGALKIHEAIKGMSVEEQLDYWRRRTQELRKQQEASRARLAKRSARKKTESQQKANPRGL